MITLENDVLDFRFPEVHEAARCAIEFQRTLRIPDDDKNYPLPPGLGAFPLRHLDDYAPQLPEAWRRRGGVVLPMHQAEAMWINFPSLGFAYPFAVKVAAGKICALTGDGWVNNLNLDPQDYVVTTEQPWLDGYCVGKGMVRQFVAMPLGEGFTAEEQLTRAAIHGGLQIVAYPLKRERYEALVGERTYARRDAPVVESVESAAAMGLAPGGRLRQAIYDDPYGLDAWDQRHASRCFVTIVNTAQWMAVTGERPPSSPPTAREYTEAGLPWFDYYDGDASAVAGAKTLETLSSVAQIIKQKGKASMPDNETVDVRRTVKLGTRRVRQVREATLSM